MHLIRGTILIIGCVAVFAQSTKDKKQIAAPLTPVFDPAAIDSTVDACVDFYQYACGTWLAKNPIPPDRPEWARFDELEERNLAILRDILQKAAGNSPKRSPLEQKIGDFYAACMDEAAIEKKGTEPIKPELDRISALADKDALPEEVARLQRAGAGVMFLFSSQQDFKNANSMIALADQGGLGLPERDYYLKDDQKSVETRQKYLEHVAKMFQLLGDSQERAAAKAQVVMTIETALATGSMDVVARRDPARIYHKTRREELEASLDPSFGWARYLKAVDAPPIENLNVAVPEFFKALDSLINTTSLDDWKTYLTWHLVHAEAPLLSTAFVDENFDFYGKFLTGTQSCGRAGNAACSSPMAIWARRSGRSTWSARSARRAKSAPCEWCTPSRAKWEGISNGSRLDVARNQAAGHREAARDHQQDRLSGQVARLFEREDRTRRRRRATMSGPPSSSFNGSSTRSASPWTTPSGR